MAWTLVTQEVQYPKELKIAALLITGRWIDFILECNKGWFSIGIYPVSYDTIATIIFFVVIFKCQLSEL